MDASKPADVDHLFVPINPDVFMSVEVFKRGMGYLYQRVVKSDKIAGANRIYLPGETEALNKEAEIPHRMHLGRT